ncbi:uncharacterized protein C8A04DRAFT_38564 [Dichotomopilus funicola]|uniref:BZIP domain-containing protein n=1 Tax=Dichotomopilus funicola TaxID=1934379 RepID=A0AAN6ZKQ2_9PEZI|nr:hypothetical protein C8A04DRAFT_38564 [Dichotomopilus funicola]
MSPHPTHKQDSPKSCKGKAKGARRVSNLSEEQRNKKRENDRIAQQNIRRRNKELIEKLQQEVEILRTRDRVDVVCRLMTRNEELEKEVRMLRKHLFIHAGRPYHPGSDTLSPNGPQSGSSGNGDNSNEYSLSSQHQTTPFGSSPYIATAAATSTHPYDQWPSSVVPVSSTGVTVNSVESSPGASGTGDDFATPATTTAAAYAHTTADGIPVSQSGNTSAPSLGSSKDAEYEDLDAGSVNDSYTTHSVPQSSTYIHEPPWSVYPTGAYYSQAAAI